jgi:hypothetical protein
VVRSGYVAVFVIVPFAGGDALGTNAGHEAHNCAGLFPPSCSACTLLPCSQVETLCSTASFTVTYVLMLFAHPQRWLALLVLLLQRHSTFCSTHSPRDASLAGAAPSYTLHLSRAIASLSTHREGAHVMCTGIHTGCRMRCSVCKHCMHNARHVICSCRSRRDGGDGRGSGAK